MPRPCSIIRPTALPGLPTSFHAHEVSLQAGQVDPWRLVHAPGGRARGRYVSRRLWAARQHRLPIRGRQRRERVQAPISSNSALGRAPRPDRLLARLERLLFRRDHGRLADSIGCLIDMEHAPNDIRSVHATMQVFASYPVASARAPGRSRPGDIKQILDIGVQSLVVPMGRDGRSGRAIWSGHALCPAGLPRRRHRRGARGALDAREPISCTKPMTKF